MQRSPVLILLWLKHRDITHRIRNVKKTINVNVPIKIGVLLVYEHVAAGSSLMSVTKS